MGTGPLTTVITEIRLCSTYSMHCTMATRSPSPKFRLSAVTLLLTDYINRFAELKTRPEIYRCYESVLRLVSGYREIILDPGGMILSWNDFFGRTTRFSENEILGQHIGLLFLPHDRQDKKPEALLAKSLHQGVSTLFGQFARKDGATFEASLKVLAVKKKNVHLGYTLALRTSKRSAGREASEMLAP